jgi:methylthioribulose-1-phosphate dehydratase
MIISADVAALQMIETGRRFDARGWAMAGSGNYSARLADGNFAITVSGRHKGHLAPGDIMRVDASGKSLDERRPSAETALHMLVYRMKPEARSVLHTHSVNAVTLGRMAGQRIVLGGYEMLKALPGFASHEDEAVLPVFENDQDMAQLTRVVETALNDAPRAPGFILRGHGLYAWAGSVEQALCAVEGLEHMIACELARAQIDGGSPWPR